MRSFIITVVLVLAGPIARADKVQRARAIFAQSCATCHVLGHAEGQLPHHAGIVDLTMVYRKLGEARLRAWLRDPRKVDKNAHCRVSLPPVETDLIVALLLLHTAPPPTTPPIQPEASQPPMPPEPPPVPAGQRRHR
jgi:hypothetical protein